MFFPAVWSAAILASSSSGTRPSLVHLHGSTCTWYASKVFRAPT